MRKFTAKIMSFNSPNLNGRVYSSEMMKKEVEKFNERIKSGGPALGEIRQCDGIYHPTSLVNVSHRIESISISDDEKSMFGEFTILDTPKGKILQNLLENTKLGCEVVGHGMIDVQSHQVENYSLERIDVAPIEQCAFPESELKEVK